MTLGWVLFELGAPVALMCTWVTIIFVLNILGK